MCKDCVSFVYCSSKRLTEAKKKKKKKKEHYLEAVQKRSLNSNLFWSCRRTSITPRAGPSCLRGRSRVQSWVNLRVGLVRGEGEGGGRRGRGKEREGTEDGGQREEDRERDIEKEEERIIVC